jgi:WD40 repeat protein
MKIWKPKPFHMIGATLVTSAGFGTLAWGPQDNHNQIFLGHREWVSAVSFTPDGGDIVSGAGNHELTSETKLWNLAASQARDLSGHTGSVEAVAFSPDGTQLATAGFDQIIRLWDLRQGYRSIGALAGHDGAIRHLAYAPDGATLISAGNDQVVRFWDVANAKERSRLNGHDVLALAPQIGCFATREIGNRTIAIRSLATGAARETLEVDNGWTMCAAFSPDGQTFAIGGLDRSVGIYRLAAAKLSSSLWGHQDYLIAIAFSPDGRWFASASQDRTVKIWDLKTGQEIRTLIGHTGPVTSVAFAPHGKRLVSGSYDKTIRVWDLEAID